MDCEQQKFEGYTRVTEILYPFSGLSSINPEVVAHAAARGTHVHNVCESIMQGLGEWNDNVEAIPYISSFKLWYENKPKVIEIEKRFFDDDMMITGQVDMIIETPEGLAIADLKTSSAPSKTWALQGSAYAYMAKNQGYDIKKIMFIHLKKTGKTPKIYEYEDHFPLFKKCFDVYQYFYARKKK